MPPPVGTVMVIVPVATVQVGCTVTEAVGVAGVAGWAFTVTLVTEEIHPLLFFAVRLYEPAAMPEKAPVVFE